MTAAPAVSAPACLTLGPRISREEAVRRLRGSGPLSGLRRGVLGDLRSIALLYVPYRLYDVTIALRGALEQARYAADALCGELDPYLAQSMPSPSTATDCDARNLLPAMLDEVRGAELLRDHLRRMIYRKGFFRAGNAEIQVRATGEMLHLPYWAGFFGRATGVNDQEAQLRVVDGLRGTVEGAKAREALLRWLRAETAAGGL